ncbi:MAG: putative 2OG-Fe(II) oxygenase [Sphingomonas bacterium]
MQWVVSDPPPKAPTPEALRSISAAIEAQPHLPALRAFRAGMMMRLGRPDDAIADFVAAMSQDSQGARYTTQIAMCHLRAGRPAAALEVCDYRVPDGPDPAWSLQRGRALVRLARVPEGQAELTRALQAKDPGFSALRSLLPTYGRTGDGGALLAFCDSLEPRHAETAGARGYRAVALSLLGRTHDALDLVDLDRCIVRVPFEPPGEFGGIEAFNQILADEVLATVPEGAPIDRHVDYLTTVRPDPARTALMVFVRHAVEDYVGRIPERDLGKALPFVPEVAELTSGSVVLRGDSGQGEHLHPTGYLSCVYHVAVPGPGTTGSDAGALRVGGCASQFAGHEPVWGTRTIMPEPGWLTLLPSHIFHTVLPTRSREPRITVPSDVRPIRP